MMRRMHFGRIGALACGSHRFTGGNFGNQGHSASDRQRNGLKEELRLALSPLRATSQDRALLRAVNVAAYTGNDCALVTMTHFRGARKSTTARRCELRSRIFPVPFHPRLVYLRELPKSASAREPLGSLTYRMTRAAVDTAITFVVPAACFFAKWMCDAWRAASDASAEELMNGVVEQLPTPYAIIGTVLITLMAAKTRPVVYIVDDIAGESNRQRSHLTGRHLLDKLVSMSPPYRIVAISSNEGLEHCFSDPAEDIRIRIPFVTATPEEMLRSIRDAARDKVWLAGVDEDVFRQVAASFPEHHAFSMRFWRTAAEVLTMPPSQFASCARPPRSFLWRIVIGLDVSSDVMFRVYALGHSAPMSDAERAKVAALVGLADVDKIPRNCPRRLALAHALLASATDEEAAAERKLCAMLATELREGLRSPHLRGNADKESVETLLRATRETGTFWVQQIDDAGKPTGVISPLHAESRTLEALQAAIKELYRKEVGDAKPAEIQVFPHRNATSAFTDELLTLRDSTKSEPYYFRVPSTAAPKDSAALK